MAHLAGRDPVLRRVMRHVKPPPSHRETDHFRSLVVAIINQQLSGKAADTITRRFVELFPDKKFPAPEDVIRTGTAKMRSAGLSGMKVKFIKGLAKSVVRGNLDFRALRRAPDEEVIERLTAVKGIGRWTAEMFLMFSLGRDDVFSYGDLGLRNAMQKLYKLKKPPTPRQAQKISAPWKPYRTLASRYLWASLEVPE